jgi:hypothetical protein
MLDKLMALVGQLYPTGRAFKMIIGGWKEALHRAIAARKEIVLNDALSTLDSAIPDNPNFTADDATQWERRLGLTDGTGNPLDKRMDAIRRKLNYPGQVAARGHFLFLEHQLQAAGFPVFVYENRFDDGSGGLVTKDPVSLGGGAVSNQHGDYQHGDAQHGAYYNKMVVNSLDPAVDARFDVGWHLRTTFFVGGEKTGAEYNGEEADVPADQETELRQLIVRLKPAQTVAYLFINYV